MRVSVAKNQRSPTVATGFETRNARDVWAIAPEPFAEAHFAVMPPELARRCIRASSRPGDIVLDPFAGAHTTAMVALQEGRRAVGCEINGEYIEIGSRRLAVFDGDTSAPIRVKPGADDGPLFGARRGADAESEPSAEEDGSLEALAHQRTR